MSEDEWSEKSFGELPTMRPTDGRKTPPPFPPPDPVTGGIMDDGSTDGTRRLQKGEVILNRYEVEGELGQGGMGVVYLCLDRVGGVRVAVKALPPDVSHDSAEMEEVRDNFQLVVGLRHSCIAGVRTLERDERGEYYLIMDVAEGESLRKWIRAKWKAGGLQPAEAVAVLRQVASALDYAHGQKVVHRDVKPGNVMIDAEGRAKVLDFGLAAQIRTSLGRTSRLFRGTSGTGPYMSPEQWEAQPQDARADQYALGVMAYEMLAGHLPFENPEISVLREAVLKGAIRDIPGLAPKAMAAIRRAMAKDPASRFPSCEAFVDALAGNHPAGNPGAPKVLLAGAAALAAALALAVGVGVWIARPETNPKSVPPSDSGPTVQGLFTPVGPGNNPVDVPATRGGTIDVPKDVPADSGKESSRDEEIRMEELRKQGYEIAGEPGSRRAVWKAGAALREYPHWITGKEEKTWFLADGYEKANPTAGALSAARWKPGWMKPGDPNTKAGQQEGTWLHRKQCVACGGFGRTQKNVPCTACNGSGWKFQTAVCPACGGIGEMRTSSACMTCKGTKMRSEDCPACQGGSAPCGSCGGRGTVENQTNMGPPFQSCPECRGKRWVLCGKCRGFGKIESPCQACGGTGTVLHVLRCPTCNGAKTVQTRQDCAACDKGLVKTDMQNCTRCNGEGAVWE